LGPLTNLAAFVTEQDDLVSKLHDLVVMGGTIAVQGNALPVAEANIAHDPRAAAMVATAPWSRPPLLVPLDVTLAATLATDEFGALAAGTSRAAQDLAAPLDFYRGAGSTFSPSGESPCHDLTAAVVAVEPTLVTCPVLPFGVDVSGGLAWGATVVDRRQPFFERAGAGSAQATPDGLAPWRIALDIDTDTVRDRYRWLFIDSDSVHPTGEHSSTGTHFVTEQSGLRP
jgi:purine nucleosidase